MQLSKFTDYSFRVLIFLAQNKEEMTTVEILAKELQASEHHIKKVVHKLANSGFIASQKGRNGGLKLKMLTNEINLADVILKMEENMNIVECFSKPNSCPFIKKNCQLKNVIHLASQSFLSEFAKKSLADVI